VVWLGVGQKWLQGFQSKNRINRTCFLACNVVWLGVGQKWLQGFESKNRINRTCFLACNVVWLGVGQKWLQGFESKNSETVRKKLVKGVYSSLVWLFSIIP